MEKWNSVNEALDFAIAREEEAADFYTGLAGNSKDASMRTLFASFAEEEKGHKRRLEAVKAKGAPAAADKKVMDLKIGDYLVDVEASPNMDYQDALIVAMKREKAAFRLYTDLAALADEPELKETFKFLAQEEAKHKLHFEVEYDEKVLTEN